jgi:DNA repair exonuclease SbcCD nuclease subunit
MSVRLLAVGDIHLGRRPSRIPASVAERVGSDALTPAAAWRIAVEQACLLEVDAVLLAGDVVEQNDDFYEAYPALRAGVETLDRAGVPVIGVAGNHDDHVLPRLADSLPRFRLLGRGGRWERAEVCAAGGEVVTVLGWSFPGPRVTESPLDSLPPLAGEHPVVGLLHCDRDQPGSAYAPVRGSALDAAATDAWLLGHIHRPDPLAAPRPVGYLGSLTALDPGEMGPRGPWLVEVEHKGAIAATHLALAPLRWEQLEVSLDALEGPHAVHERIVQAIGDLDDRIVRAGAAPLAVGCRLVLTGRSRWRGEVERILVEANPATAPPDVRGGIAYFIDGWRNAAQPELDLDAAAAGSDPVAMLARRILVLRRGLEDADCRAMVEPVRARLADIVRAQEFARLERPAPDAARTVALLEQAALRALDALLAQREGVR